jgi:hypothetical protein
MTTILATEQEVMKRIADKRASAKFEAKCKKFTIRGFADGLNGKEQKTFPVRGKLSMEILCKAYTTGYKLGESTRVFGR